MMKKYSAVFLALLLSVSAMTACSSGQDKDKKQDSSSSSVKSDSEGSESGSNKSESSQSTVSSDGMFADGDYKDVTSSAPDAEIILSGSSGTISDTTRGSSGSDITINAKGVYHVTGSSDGASIVINDSTKSGNIYLILDNVSMKSSSKPCIDIEAGDKVIIQCVGSNSLSFNPSDDSTKTDGAVYSESDVTVNGSGSLNVSSDIHGIVCKKDLKITSSTLSVKSAKVGIKAANSLRIGGGTINVESDHDGIQLSNKKNSSYLYFEKADLTMKTGYDGISVKGEDSSSDFSGYVTLNGGKINITTASGAGSDQSKNSDTSQKGIKTDGKITVSQTDLTVSSADDALHGNADILVESGNLTLSSSDDGITAAGLLTINGGTIKVTKSYEGLEGADITINNGDISITSSDDGINTAGGSDSSQTDDRPWSGKGSDAKLTINGGKVYLNASGDGLDSNGSIYITGGTTIVEGPSRNDNGAIDKGDVSDCVASITGGTVLALGSAGMAVNFDTGSQCSALVTLSGKAGDEIKADDGSDFSFTATKSFECAVYSSPSLEKGKTYTLTAGSASANMDFSSSLYYSDVASRSPGGFGGRGGFNNMNQENGDNTNKRRPENMPSRPDGEMPSIPEGGFPSMPDGEMPGMPDGEIPSMPEGGFPGSTGDGNPGMPGSSVSSESPS